jgi:hypothetical protein
VGDDLVAVAEAGRSTAGDDDGSGHTRGSAAPDKSLRALPAVVVGWSGTATPVSRTTVVIAVVGSPHKHRRDRDRGFMSAPGRSGRR